MKIGYARVSSDEQNLDLQRDALSAAGCRMIHEDAGVSGAARRRPGLGQALATMQPGDALVTWRLDRLGRSLPHLIELVATLQAKGCEFVSLSEAIDTTSAGGKLVFHIMGALAEFERALIVERTRAGMASARTRGRAARRQPLHALAGHARFGLYLILAKQSGRTVSDQCRPLSVTPRDPDSRRLASLLDSHIKISLYERR